MLSNLVLFRCNLFNFSTPSFVSSLSGVSAYRYALEGALVDMEGVFATTRSLFMLCYFLFKVKDGWSSVDSHPLVRHSGQACRDGFLWCTRSYLRSWDRGIAVVFPASSTLGVFAERAPVTEASGKLVAGLEVLSIALRITQSALPSVRAWKLLVPFFTLLKCSRAYQRHMEPLRASMSFLLQMFALWIGQQLP